MPGPTPPTADRIARVLLDAEEHGDAAAARLHGMGERTVRLWRARYAARPDVAELCRGLRASITAGWLEKAQDARLQALHRIAVLLEKPRPRLSDVVRAMTVVHEMILSHELMAGELAQPRSERTRPTAATQ